jgi:agmatine deiminase
MPNDDIPTGWHMPAEWSPHEATWLAWPHNRRDWPGKFAPIPWVYAEILRHLTRSEKVHLLVNDAAAEAKIRRFLSRSEVHLSQIKFFRQKTDRVWTRDFGPIFVVNGAGEVGYTHWRFNGWAKYDDWKLDTQIPAKVKLKMPSWTPHHNGRRVVLEGGSIDVNGSGLLMTTEECLQSEIQERNPGFSREDYETIFRDYLGIEKTIWLGCGIAGDDTHGHVDDLARFVGPRTVVLAQESNEADLNYVPLRENLDRLRSAKLDVIPLPMPHPVLCDGQRLPASYANFYIANHHVLVPTFNDPNDVVALGTLRELFPDRTVVGIHAVDLVWGLGTLHCMTQQQPRPRKPEAQG